MIVSSGEGSVTKCNSDSDQEEQLNEGKLLSLEKGNTEEVDRDDTTSPL